MICIVKYNKVLKKSVLTNRQDFIEVMVFLLITEFVWNIGNANSAVAGPKPGWERRKFGRGVSKNNTQATETTAREITLSGGGSDATQTPGLITEGDQSRQDVPSLTAELLTPKCSMHIGCWNVRTLYQTWKLAQTLTKWRDTSAY